MYWPEEAIEIPNLGSVTELSVHHDLGDDRHGTGYEVLRLIEEAVAVRGFEPPVIHVHSANTSARVKMLAAVASIHRLVRSRGLANRTGTE